MDGGYGAYELDQFGQVPALSAGAAQHDCVGRGHRQPRLAGHRRGREPRGIGSDGAETDSAVIIAYAVALRPADP